MFRDEVSGHLNFEFERNHIERAAIAEKSGRPPVVYQYWRQDRLLVTSNHAPLLLPMLCQPNILEFAFTSAHALCTDSSNSSVHSSSGAIPAQPICCASAPDIKRACISLAVQFRADVDGTGSVLHVG